MIIPGPLPLLLTTLIAAVAATNAEKRGELTVGVVATRLGEDEKMLGGTFEPTIQWTRQGTISDYEYNVGVIVREKMPSIVALHGTAAVLERTLQT
jgi:hypothetical protein